MQRPLNRRQALKTLAVTGLGTALAARLAPFAEAHRAPYRSSRQPKPSVFDSHRELKNSFWVGPHLFSFLAEATTTGGSYTFIEVSSPPGAVVPPHTHTREDETLFILEGSLEVVVNDVVRQTKPGEHVFMPRGGVHTFRVTGAEPARVLVMFTPGGLEGAYKQIAKPAYRLRLPPTPPKPTPEQQQRTAEIFAGFGYYFVT